MAQSSRTSGGQSKVDEAAAAANATRVVPVLVNDPLGREHLDAIAATDPRIRLIELSHPGRWDAEEQIQDDDLDAKLARAEVLFSVFRFPIEWASKAPNLKWVQLASAGADVMLRAGLLDLRPDLLLTTSSGIHEVSISEHILAMALYFTRGFNVAVRNQHLHRWQRFDTEEAQGKSVCLVGYGPIARRTAMLFGALGARVLVVRASIDEQQAGVGPVERFYPVGDLNAALSVSDFVVIAAPRTPASENMIGPEQFAAMKKGAILINISRGALVDEPALIDALRQGLIAAAGLDVVAQEPLPADSPLWGMPNVLITPHLSGSSVYYDQRASALFRDNLARYLRGEPLKNLVNKERGY